VTFRAVSVHSVSPWCAVQVSLATMTVTDTPHLNIAEFFLDARIHEGGETASRCIPMPDG
jgi:hypothetical protein